MILSAHADTYHCQRILGCCCTALCKAEDQVKTLNLWLTLIITLNLSMLLRQAEDVAAAVVYALSAPRHVDVNDVLMRPVQQKT